MDDIDSVLEKVFGPEPKDGTLEWLLWVLNPSQIADIYVMLEQNAADDLGGGAAYNQRAQRLFKALKENGEEEFYLTLARKNAKPL